MGMRISCTRSALFNFLNGIEMKIILNKWGEFRMGATHPESVPLPSESGNREERVREWVE